jgi:hypothetical protein
MLDEVAIEATGPTANGEVGREIGLAAGELMR